MSDIYLKPTAAGEDIQVSAGVPKMTGGLDNAVYMSLFTSDFWANDNAEPNEVYDSRIPTIIGSGTLSNRTRLDIIAEANRVLSWIVSAGIAEAIGVTAEIPKLGHLYLAVRIDQPQQTIDFAYLLNWDTQEIIVREGRW